MAGQDQGEENGSGPQQRVGFVSSFVLKLLNQGMNLHIAHLDSCSDLALTEIRTGPRF